MGRSVANFVRGVFVARRRSIASRREKKNPLTKFATEPPSSLCVHKLLYELVGATVISVSILASKPWYLKYKYTYRINESVFRVLNSKLERNYNN